MAEISEDLALKFARLALQHVRREFPNKLDHVMTDARDVQRPSSLHPVFYGSFDWHSCVHGYWLLARVARRHPGLPVVRDIEALFETQITPDKIAIETDYARHSARAGFERPYGWAWLLMLSAELHRRTDALGHRWAVTLRPLADVFARRFVEFLPKATYPIRVGTHFNTAFAVALSLEYAEVCHDASLGALLKESAVRWFGDDRDIQCWEPGGDDFLSSALIEAECMRRVLPHNGFLPWLNRFLPHIDQRQPATLFQPATVSDRSDGKIGHLDGLNLSRAWCWRSIAAALPHGDNRRSAALASAEVHLTASLPFVAGDYMGEHWLATFALLALDAPEPAG